MSVFLPIKKSFGSSELNEAFILLSIVKFYFLLKSEFFNSFYLGSKNSLAFPNLMVLLHYLYNFILFILNFKNNQKFYNIDK